MPPFEGGGGKKPKRKRKPTTASGVAFSQAVELEQLSTRREATTIPLDHRNPDRSGFDNFDQDHSNQYDHQFTDYIGNDTNFTNPDHTNHSDTRIQQLTDYFQSEHYKRKKLLEEKNWAEVYDAMFSSFKQCAVKTADWGDKDKWRHDWKEPCLCQDKRFRPLVLVDIMSRRETEVEFCSCQGDQVRLIQMGYIGTSPKYPRTAFSIRLLRFHDIIWKNCAVSITPFSKAIDEFLDSNNPLVLVSQTASDSGPLYTVREWRKTLSASVDAYREMLRREKVVSEELMEMGPMDKLAEICPKCFGPPVPGKTPEEPDYIVCMDGNFQHRRHLAASHELSEYSNQTSLFISPEEVEDMESCMNIQINEAEEHPNLDRCTEQHTAANDSRGSTTWKACDDTGIFGLAYMRSSHHNEVGKTRSVKRLLDRGLHVEKLLVESKNKLTEIREKHNFTIEYLTEQWLRQRQCQLEAMETESEREMIKLVGDLVNLEDELQDAQDEIELLRAKHRRTRTVEEQERLELLPNTVTSLEEQIEILVDELGSEAFRNLPGASE
ncbi:hypothetical protein PGT21_009631 [Puccinia graminis f. sp. tritici]|uniref:CxC1-like cysteine cluster associated with KDZ transposases domain-containing protein n=1 Tax=Puccinia graminis f. sp. tritici TaxID=56615 RepID=A0A5B0NVU6_PUCGR|nr:hypothetical protein PGT21_009631 [Puccinia graminis f. sp. tritici]